MSRPKRKAATNKSYNDFIDESIFEDRPSEPPISRKRVKTAPNSPSISVSDSDLTSLPSNWQPEPGPNHHFSNLLDLTDAYIDLGTQTLYCPATDSPKSRRKSAAKFQIKKGDFIYMVSEPPGEPYYVARVMGFKIKGGRASEQHNGTTNENSAVVDAKQYQFQVQWFYRPRDISKFSNDSRLLYASMHSDTCPLASFRGLVTVRHKLDIEASHEEEGRSPSPASALETYTSEPNCFYFDKLFDRYMVKFYDIIPTSTLLAESPDSQCPRYLEALHKRFEYVFVETLRSKTFVESFSKKVAVCDLCDQWCSNHDSVTCASCDKHFHMYCLDPPLMKKPSRGFSWSCAPCTKQYDLAHQKQQTLMLSHDNKLTNEQQISADSEESGEVSEEETVETKESKTAQFELPKYEKLAIEFLERDKGTSFEDRRLREEWCMRYLGLYAKLEDGVDVDDRSPYPRASTRLGAKHQATHLPEFRGHPIVYYDGEEGASSTKKKAKKPATKTKKHDEIVPTRLEVPSAYKDKDPLEYPQWLQPRPKGYVERGVDDGEGITCDLLWKAADSDIQDNFARLDAYVASCEPIALGLKVLPTSPNFFDAVVKDYMVCKGDSEKARAMLSKLTRSKLKEPTFTKEEVKRFESGIRKYGSELYPVQKMVRTQPVAMVVRYYYLWKKTAAGRLIWGNFEGRVKRKDHKVKEEKEKQEEEDPLANQADDSSYDMEKMVEKKPFVCKHCATESSIQWFRVTANPDSKKTIALCFRCARLWRRYAVVWEEPLEVERKKKLIGWKRRIESELVEDSQAILAETRGTSAKDTKESSRRTTPAPTVPIVSKLKKKPATAEPRKTIKISRQAAPAALSQIPPPRIPATPPSTAKGAKSTAKPTASSSKRKAKSGDTKPAPPLVKRPKRKEPEKKQPKAAAKKLVMEPPDTSIGFPVFNGNFKVPELATGAVDFLVPVTEEWLSSLGIRNLLSMESGWPSVDSAPSPILQGPPMSPCSICSLDESFSLKHDPELPKLDSKSDSESLSNSEKKVVCRGCGITVHLNCAGFVANAVPASEWLCEPCVNNMLPAASTDYQCCLCHTSFPKTGSSNNYLVHVEDTDRWCHFVCAILSGDGVNMRVAPTRRRTRSLLDPSALAHIFTITSVTSLLFRNHSKQCHICRWYGGAMLECQAGPTPAMAHISCAQITPGFSLRFRLEKKCLYRFLTRVDSDVGRVVPVIVQDQLLVNGLHSSEPSGQELGGVDENAKMVSAQPTLPNHSLPTYGMTQFALRMSGSTTLKPLFQLFVEDMEKDLHPAKLLGPIARANQLVASRKNFCKTEPLAEVEGTSKTCSRCLTAFSPIWWKAGPGDNHVGVLCNVCHHKTQQQDEDNDKSGEEEPLENVINASLDPTQFGLDSIDDYVNHVQPEAVPDHVTVV